MSRRNMKNKPKRGLGQAVTRQRRKAAEAARDAAEQREAREKQSALDEMRRATQTFEESEDVAQRKFAHSLFRSIVNGQTAVLRAWGMDQGVKCRTHRDSGVAAWTDFVDVHCYWPEADIPNRLDTMKVADVIGQIKGVMQHEFGHLRYTTSWKEVIDNAKYPRRHGDDEHHMMTCWNMLEDERMETCVVNAVPRIGRYFGTMVANVILGNTDMRQAWLMLAGREYLPYEVLEASYDLFDDWAKGQGFKDAADTWYDLVQDYKAAATHQEIMDAVANAYDYIKKLGATIPDTVDNHGQQDENETGNDPSQSAQQRGNILDMFKDHEQQKSKNAKKSDKPSPPQQKKEGSEGQGEGDEGDEEGEGEGSGNGEGDESDEQGQGNGQGEDDPACDCMTEEDPMDPTGPERVLQHASSCPLNPDWDEGDAEQSGGGNPSQDEYGNDSANEGNGGGENNDVEEVDPQDNGGGPGQSNRGEGSKQKVSQTDEDDLQDALSEMAEGFKESIRNDADVMEMQWNATDTSGGEGLPEYDGEGTETMVATVQAKAEGVSLGMQEALNSFLTECAPYWHNRQENGVIDALAYRTKQPGDRDFRRELVGVAQQGLDVHVSMLCDVSYSMSGGYGSTSSPIQALSEALYATALACDNMGIGRTFSLWSSGQEYYQVWSGGAEPTPTVWPAMGGTDPTKALDDLHTHNPEEAENHLVLIFTDGAWGGNFPNLQRWGGEGRRIVLVRYGRYEGEVQTDMGADEHIAINDVADLPGHLTHALMDVLASGNL